MNIIDYKKDVQDEYYKLIDVIDKLELRDKYNLKIKEIDELMNKVNPSMMFFGVYNAGKSTLLNCVFGEKVASVADVPETHRVSSYTWNNYKLFDTPGINGPVDDEKVSKEEIKKHDVILFVIDDGDSFDSDKVTNEILDIIIEKKPLILVLNCKQSLDEDVVNRKREKISINIDIGAKKRGITDIFHRYEFIAVNAQSGYEARIKNDDILLKWSRIDLLESIMNRNLKSSNAYKELINPSKHICYVVDSIFEELTLRLESNESKKFAQVLSELSDKKSYAIKMAENNIKAIVANYNSKMYQSLVNGNNIDELNNEMSNEVQKIIESACNDFVNEMFNEIEEFNIDINAKVDVSVEKENYSFSHNSYEYKEDEDNEDDIGDILSKAIIISRFPIPNPTPIPTPIIVAIALKLGKVLFGDKGNNKAKAEAEMREMRQQENRRQNALQEARTELRNQLDKFENEAIKSSKDILNNYYEKTKQKIEKVLLENNEKLESDTESLNIINEVKAELEGIIARVS